MLFSFFFCSNWNWNSVRLRCVFHSFSIGFGLAFFLSDEIYFILYTYGKNEKRTYSRTHTHVYNEFLRWNLRLNTHSEKRKNQNVSAGRWSIRWIQWNAYSILFLLVMRVCVSVRLFISFFQYFQFKRTESSSIYSIHLLFFSVSSSSSFFYLSISFCRSWIALLFWLWPRPRALKKRIFHPGLFLNSHKYTIFFMQTTFFSKKKKRTHIFDHFSTWPYLFRHFIC